MGIKNVQGGNKNHNAPLTADAYYDNYGTPVGFASDYRTGQTFDFKLSGRSSTPINREALERFQEEAKKSQEAKWLKVAKKAKKV